MRILAISQVYYPDTASTAQHLKDLLEALSAKGHQVSVFTSARNYENPRIKYPKKEINSKVNIYRISNTGFGKKNKLTRAIDFLSFNLIIASKLLFINKNNYDLLIGMTSPPFLSYMGIKIAKLKEIRFVYWTMDLQPELSITAGYFKEGGRIATFLQKRGDYIFKHAHKIITLDHFMKNHIEKRIGNASPIIDIIPVWPVMNSVYLGSRLENSFRIENHFGNKIVIMYSGNHSVMHPLDTLLEAAVMLKEDKRFIFVHIGGGIRLQEVKEYKKKFDLKNIVLLPYQPRENIHISLGSSDIQVISLGDKCVGYTHPNKIYGAMFIGKPVIYIGPDESHITEILDKCDGNISVRHGEYNKLVESLIRFAETTENQRINIGNKNRQYAESHFHPKILLSNMVTSIEEIMV